MPVKQADEPHVKPHEVVTWRARETGARPNANGVRELRIKTGKTKFVISYTRNVGRQAWKIGVQSWYSRRLYSLVLI